MSKKILIEFVGLPGSGKTTIANELCKSNASYKNILPQRDNFTKPIYETIYRHLTAVLFIIKKPIYSYNIFKLIYKSKQFTLSDLRATFINLIYKINLYSKIKTKYISVLDEGVLHALMSINISSQNKQILIDDVAKVLNFKKKIDKWIVVYIDNDDKITLKRLKSRSDKINKPHRILKYNLDTELPLIRQVFDHILRAFVKKHNVQIIRINNVFIDKSKRKLIDKLEEYL